VNLASVGLSLVILVVVFVLVLNFVILVLRKEALDTDLCTAYCDSEYFSADQRRQQPLSVRRLVSFAECVGYECVFCVLTAVEMPACVSDTSVLTNLSQCYLGSQHGTAEYQQASGVTGAYSSQYGGSAVDGYFASEGPQSAAHIPAGMM